MRLALTGRNLTITPALRLVVTRRLEKLDRLLHKSIISAQIALQVQKDRVKADVRVTTRGDHDFSAHGLAADARASVIDALTRVEHQADKVRGKWEGRKRRSTDIVAAETSDAPATSAPAARAPRKTADAVPAARVIRVRRANAKPMQLEDAIMRVDAAPGAVLVFRDASLDRVQVLVRRADGHLGLVDPDA
jgi:putative sigma-54 modulation protein